MAYAAKRASPYCIAQPSSRYLMMRDGCRLAVDLYVPRMASTDPCNTDESHIRFPTIVLFTPYYRRFKLKKNGMGECAPSIAKFRDCFIARGYAIVAVDIRGTGASFGTRDSFRSPRERDDSKEVVDWIVQQPWSNGVVGATGISYLGAAADFLATTGHPAVKAIAPLFSVWDTYTDNYYPGGIALTALMKHYDDLMIALDHDQRDKLGRFTYYANPDFDGPHPVDEDAGGELLKQAVQQHLGNFRQTEFMPEFRFREDPLVYDPDFSSAAFSPYSLADKIPESVAVLSISGWLDGGGYMNGAISRFLTLSKNPVHLMLGPWDHGARIDTSPWRKTELADTLWLDEVLRFFDHYLLELPTGLDEEAPIHYFAMHAEQWRAAEQWPPYDAYANTEFFLTPECRLQSSKGTSAKPERQAGAADRDGMQGANRRRSQSYGEDLQHSRPPETADARGAVGFAEVPEQAKRSHTNHHVDFSMGTGAETRYERIAAIHSTTYYSDWQGRTERMCSFTSEPLDQALELAGHAIVNMFLSSSEPDGALFVYLTEIEADGCARYVTEGLLRLLHRKMRHCPPNYVTTWPFHSFRKDDAQAMTPGVFERVSFALLPTAWCFAEKSRIRVSIAGADRDHCGQVPHGRPPVFGIGTGGALSSSITLPLRDLQREHLFRASLACLKG